MYADENILYFNEHFDNVVFNCNEMGILNIDLNNINLDNNFDEEFWLGILNLKNAKNIKNIQVNNLKNI